VAVAGHSHCGKTTLISAILAAAGASASLGRVEDGTAVTAYDDEEIARRMTLSNAVAWCEWGGVKVNCVDTPGFSMFVHEAKAAMLPVETALMLVDASAGVEPMTTRVWAYADEFYLPRILVVNKLDRDSGKAGGGQDSLGEILALLESLRNAFGRNVVPVQLPIGRGASGTKTSFRGVIDLVSMTAFFYPDGSKGKGRPGEIPAELLETAKSAHEALVELVAEGKDELMVEFFAEGTIPEEHLISALREAIREDRIFPVLFASGQANIGVDRLLDFLKVYAPAPTERAPVAARANALAAAGSGNGHASEAAWRLDGTEMVTRPVADNQPVAVYVFKTISDPFAGHISFFKVFSGVVRNDASLQNYGRNCAERFSHLAVMEGKVATSVSELHAGDIGAVAKLKNTFTGDTLGDKAHPVFFEPAALPEPAIAFAIEPKTRADEDKLATGLHRLMEEDTLIRFYRDPQTHEFLIAGAGQQHIEVVVSKLRKRYHTEVTLQAPPGCRGARPP
jgi:elongation factor G